MPPWTSWKTIASIILVCGAHFALLTIFLDSGTPGNPLNGIRASPANISILMRSVSDASTVPTFIKSAPLFKAGISEANVAQEQPNQQYSALPEATTWLSSKYGSAFFDSDAVDKSAEPNDVFEFRLGQLLPLNIQPVVLEFWIEDDGRTVEVRCLEGACSDEVAASLIKLTDLRFSPALKDGQTVANRKVIQIDIKPTFGL